MNTDKTIEEKKSVSWILICLKVSIAQQLFIWNRMIYGFCVQYKLFLWHHFAKQTEKFATREKKWIAMCLTLATAKVENVLITETLLKLKEAENKNSHPVDNFVLSTFMP